MQLPDDWFNWILWLFFQRGVWIIWVAAPLWWPALRVALRRGRLPHPLAYVVVSASLAYGLFAAVFLVVALPVKIIDDYLVPQLLEAGIAGGAQLHAADTAVTVLTGALFFSLPFAAIFGTRALTRRWPALCGFGAHNDRMTG